MKDKRLKVGIAGYGVVGKRRRLFIDMHPNLQTVAVCDQYFGDKGTMDDGVLFFPTYKEMLKTDLDVVFVSLPNYLASEVTIACLEKGMHVFCEKPPGRDVADVERVIEVEKNNPELLLKYGFNHRYHDSVREALKIVRSGELGEIINLRGIYGKSKIIPFSGGWRAERRFAGGGILLDQGIHMVDLMSLFCGEFCEVKSFVSNNFWKHDVEDNAYALLRDMKGRIAILHSSATQWQHCFSLDIALTSGYLVLHGILSGSKSYGEEKLTIGRRDDADTGTAREETVTYLEDNSWKDEIFEFGDAVAGLGVIENGSTAEALASMKIVYGIYFGDPDWRNTYGMKCPEGIEAS